MFAVHRDPTTLSFTDDDLPESTSMETTDLTAPPEAMDDEPRLSVPLPLN